MCTLLIHRRPMPGVRLGVLANRDELYERAPGRFTVLADAPLVLGGRDPEAGGTWLAASAAGFVVAVTNARLQARRGADQRSRGQLARDLALAPSAVDAAARLAAEELGRYAPVNAVVATADGFTVASNLPGPRCATLEDAAVGLGNLPAFEDDPRVAALLAVSAPTDRETPEGWAERLRALAGRHEVPAACHHAGPGGTVSATVMLIADSFADSRLWHVDGPPCQGGWTALDVRGMAAAGEDTAV